MTSSVVLRNSSGSFLYFSGHLDSQSLQCAVCEYVDLLLTRDLISSEPSCLGLAHNLAILASDPSMSLSGSLLKNSLFSESLLCARQPWWVPC